MCLVGGGSGTNKPKVPPVAPPPNKGKVITKGTAVAPPPENITAIETARAALSKRQGIFGNIKTSPTGDSSYGSASMSGGYASFGSSPR